MQVQVIVRSELRHPRIPVSDHFASRSLRQNHLRGSVLVRLCDGVIKVVLGQYGGIFGFLEEFRDGVLNTVSNASEIEQCMATLCLHLTLV